MEIPDIGSTAVARRRKQTGAVCCEAGRGVPGSPGPCQLQNRLSLDGIDQTDDAECVGDCQQAVGWIPAGSPCCGKLKSWFPVGCIPELNALVTRERGK